MTMNTLTKNERVKGMIYGSALGDAWGYVTEFSRIADILFERPGIPSPLVVTDDTQMSLYNMKAIGDITETFKDRTDGDVLKAVDGAAVRRQKDVLRIFAHRHIEYHLDPNNNRAPGIAVSESLDKLHHLATFKEITGREGSEGNNSKGCGTIMRAPWIGALNISNESVVNLALLQSQTTHDHPVAWLSAGVAALLVHKVLFEQYFEDDFREDPYGRALDALDEIKNVTEKNHMFSEIAPHHYVELSNLLHNSRNILEYILDGSDSVMDLSLVFGEGNTADSLLSCALAAVAIYHNRPFEGIQAMVYTDGDSDSIAAVGGSFLGALNGYDAFGMDIAGQIEPLYSKELEEACDWLTTLAN
jgi:ADP-ribosylglycohydrolase